jgi:exosortase/archaeosortase
MNLLRVGRPADRTLAWVSFAGCVGWVVVAVAFGRLIENMLDFRPLINLILALSLAAFSLRTALGKITQVGLPQPAEQG